MRKVLAMVVAVRQALDYTGTPRALLVCLLGWLAQVVAATALLMVLQPSVHRRDVSAAPPSEPAPTAGYLGVIKPSGVAPPVE